MAPGPARPRPHPRPRPRPAGSARGAPSGRPPPPRRRARRGRRDLPAELALAQGAYYVATGVWPLVHMRSFELVTGPKVDRWLVRTVGALAAGVGAGLLRAGLRGRVPADLRVIAALCAAGFVAVETPEALRGRIRPVYLLDAIAETGFALGAALSRGERGEARPRARDARPR